VAAGVEDMAQLKYSAPEPTEIAGRYEIVSKLGAGAFGTVYKAKDKILGRMVAIKTIRMESLVAAGASPEEMLQRFMREAQVAAQLKHPNIVTIYDINTAEGLSYLAMEFIDGVGLDRIISTEGPMPLERAASLGAQVADGLDFAHKGGVVHRDIKPANIMIEAADRVKVTDFGIAKPTDGGDHLTMTGSLLGTPSYMSPEQARGTDLDGRSDLFALGCVLYEMAAGKKAFRGDSITGLIFKIITEEPPPLRELRPDVSDEYLRIVQKALGKAVDARYQSGAEMKADLEALVRPGSVPTVRVMEMPTAPGLLSVPGSATLSSSPTAATAGGPTQVSPPTAMVQPTAVPTQVAAPPPPRPSTTPARPATAPRPVPPRSGSNVGLLVALLLMGLVFVGGAAVAGWWFFLRTPRIQDADLPSTQIPSPIPPISTATPPPNGQVQDTLGGPATTLPSGNQGSTTTPVPSVEPTAKVPAPPTGPVVADGPRTQTQPPSTGRETTSQPTETRSAQSSFLDEEPQDSEGDRGIPEGYRRGGYGSFPGSGRRPLPRRLSPTAHAPAERAAIATLRHIISAEMAYQKAHDRYGTFDDLKQAQELRLDVPVQTRAFVRRNYRFTLSVEGDDFTVEAVPDTPGLRRFSGDSSERISAAGE
jgi:eukaryotic-like serine/threonine-protein kinase